MEEIFFLLMLTLLGYSEGEPTYPATMTVSSTGEAANKHPECLGVYKKTAQTWSGIPVWQSTVRDDRFFFYQGITTLIYI